MDFFQKLGNTLSNTGKDIAEKTKKLSDTSKLNHEITKQQESINRVYSQIGKVYFDNYSNLDYPDLKELCDSIKESNEKIEEYKSEITKIKGIINCPKCNSEVSASATFCGSCGFKLKEEQVASEVLNNNTNVLEANPVVDNNVQAVNNNIVNNEENNNIINQ